ILTTYTYGNYFALTGYLKGRMAAVDLVGSKKSKMLTEVLSSFGLILLGFIGAKYLQIDLMVNQFDVYWTYVLEGLLSLFLILGVHYYLSKKGLDLLKGMVFITIIVCSLLLVGIL
ncbi:MAG: PTS system mannose/fructose/sorbose family transporter subunit IID, partial [Erysipelotrichaceae bacterium]|nr:PTS system mannose/fructose/sorbose family transporter subunit IID [Erysipelotrichaceae bacterium]